LLTTMLAGFGKYLGSILPLPPFFWGVLTFVVSFALVTTLFAFIFKVLPDVKLAWRDVWMGAAVTALLFEIGKFALSFYLGKQAAASAYGAATSVILLLLWIYYSSCILFFGAEFTEVYAKARGRVIEPKHGAEPMTAAARAHEGLVPATAPAVAAKTSVTEPKRELLPRPEPQVLDDVPPRAETAQPLGALLAVTGASMVLGLLSRGWAQKTKRPATQLKEGLYGLGREAAVSLASAASRAKAGLEQKLR
jgi:membrane protein